MAIPMEHYTEAAAYIRRRMIEQPEVCLVLGSGLGRLAEEVEDAVSIPYEDIPHFPRSTVASHAGRLVLGRLNGRPAAVMAGRFHYYEGYSMETVAFYVRVMHLLQVKKLLITNAAGGVNERFQVGDFMLITDHIKFFTDSPARGAALPAFGERFFDLSRVYTPRLQRLAADTAEKLGISLRRGVYFYMAGPQFETPAEIRAIRLLGGDAVGMSTVPEVLAAAQCGMEVLGISCITNLAAGMTPGGVVSDDEVKESAGAAADAFCALMRALAAAV